jgi:hypothetical protein
MSTIWPTPRRTGRVAAILFAGLGLVLGAVGAAPAVAAPVWTLDVHHSPTHFAPDSVGEYWVDVANVGNTASSGVTTVKIQLPTGIKRKSVIVQNDPGTGDASWTCPGKAGASTVSCTTSNPVARHSVSRSLILRVDVDPAATGTRFAKGSISGGGAPLAPLGAGCAEGVAACTQELTEISGDPARFGVVDDSFKGDFYGPDGVTPVRQAASHPDNAVFSFDLNAVPDPGQPGLTRPVGNVRDVRIDLPPGFVGDPTAVGECDAAELVSYTCPPSSQVGRAEVKIAPALGGNFWNTTVGVFNMVDPNGVVNDLGFTPFGVVVHVKASLEAANNYSVKTTVSDINEILPAFESKVTIWGVPGDSSHDSERCPDFSGGGGRTYGTTTNECPSGIVPKAFMTVPANCEADLAMKLSRYDSWDETGVFGPDLFYPLSPRFGECDQVPFDPTVSIAPTADAADSPSGLDVRIDLPQDDDPDGIGTSPLKDATVTLPEGITVNPASANGLAACTPAQISLGTDDAVKCPDASRIASAQVTTVLPDPVQGTVYLATPHDNPFGTLLAGYIVLSNPDRGILVKIPGRIAVDPATGQLTGTFKDNPQLPFSEFELHFKGGAHSTLITPKTCGDYTTEAEFAPWSGTPAVQPSADFTISQAPGGGTCPTSEAAMPNSPAFDAGTSSPVSKNFSPFVLHLRRQDGSQRFGAFDVSLPPGLTGKLAGTALCSEETLAGATVKSGREEQASPSCPLSSHVGEVNAATGAGPDPYDAKGEAYLAGPYKGAPISLAVITPAVAGPFDLGTILIRTPLRIDPKTAQITAVSDPIPQMLQGIPTDVRSVDVVMDRPQFTLTGTGCDPASVGGLLSSTLGQTVPLSVRYQLSDCGRLRFKPAMKLFLRGKTRRGGHPALTVVLQPRPGDANIASLSLAMPSSEFLEQSHIKTICTRVQFAADQCPAAAVYGKATVTTSLLDYPLAGNVYLRSSDNLLPDLVPALEGPSWQPVKVEAAGRTDSIKGGIRNTFDFIPDAPFTKLTTRLPGGAKGLLVNSRDICQRPYYATVKYTAHNNRTYVDHPKLRVKCKG